MRVRVKICGITDPAGVESAIAAGADAVGFVLATSPRRVALGRALELAALVPPLVSRVAVLGHPDAATIREVAAALAPHWIQAETTPEIEAALEACALPGGASLLRVLHDGDDLLERLPRRAGTVLVEGPGRGGRGVSADWSRAALLARRVRLILAGGLTPDNVAAAIESVRPFGVDVASGVESSPGVKDPVRVARFLAAVRRAEAVLERRGHDA
jgi:phosphoribosylanthranilate isomerase